MKAVSLKKNFIFQTIYQIITFVVPFIIAPYLTRVLGSKELGIYTYSFSIVSYFVILANLGIAKHGQRIIAARRDDSIALRKTFWSLLYVHVFFSLVAVLFYVGYITLVKPEYNYLYIIQSFIVLSALTDISWLFYGLEDFKSVVIRNIIVKIAECVLIFIFVNSQADTGRYALIISLSTFVGQLVLIPDAIKRVKPIKVDLRDCVEHIKPLFILFISVVAVSLYTIFDKTLLGLLSTKENVAFYEYANKMVMIPKQFVYVIGTVIFPRACLLYAKKEFSILKKYIDISMYLTCLLAFGFISVFMAVSDKLCVLYLGQEFISTGMALFYMSPLIAIVMIGDVLRSEYLIPAGKDTLFTICIIISGVLNVCLSFLLIPRVGILGAILGTIGAELFGTLYQIIASRSFYPIKFVVKNILPFLFCGVVTFLAVHFVDSMAPTSWTWLFVELILSAIIYLFMCICVMLLSHDVHIKDIRSLLFNKE